MKEKIEGHSDQLSFNLVSPISAMFVDTLGPQMLDKVCIGASVSPFVPDSVARKLVDALKARGFIARLYRSRNRENERERREFVFAEREHNMRQLFVNWDLNGIKLLRREWEPLSVMKEGHLADNSFANPNLYYRNDAFETQLQILSAGFESMKSALVECFTEAPGFQQELKFNEYVQYAEVSRHLVGRAGIQGYLQKRAEQIRLVAPEFNYTGLKANGDIGGGRVKTDEVLFTIYDRRTNGVVREEMRFGKDWMKVSDLSSFKTIREKLHQLGLAEASKQVSFGLPPVGQPLSIMEAMGAFARYCPKPHVDTLLPMIVTGRGKIQIRQKFHRPLQRAAVKLTAANILRREGKCFILEQKYHAILDYKLMPQPGSQAAIPQLDLWLDGQKSPIEF